MKLFLASEAKHPQSIERLKQFFGTDLSKKHIVYIPTAANGEYYGAWKNGESIKIATSLNNSIDIIELESYRYQNIEDRLSRADILWVAGGMTGYLLYFMRASKFDKILPGLLSKGTIYVGSSAGSMVCSKTQFASEWYFDDPEPGASLVSGIGLIDFEIYPHYEDHLHEKIEKEWTKGTIYLLKNGEAITVENDLVSVLGEKRIIEK